jgi:preprotein translocase subunit SecB
VRTTNKVIASAKISGVRLVGLETSTSVGTVGDVEEPVLSVEHGATIVEGPGKSGHFAVNTNLKCRIVSGKKQEVYFSLDAVFEVLYRIPADLEYTEEEMKDFVELNAVFNAWPYFREIVQSILSRMNLPTITLPLFRYGKVPTKEIVPKTAT